MVLLPTARHEILQERDEIRAQFWAAFDAFMPGGREEAAALYRATAERRGRGPATGRGGVACSRAAATPENPDRNCNDGLRFRFP